MPYCATLVGLTLTVCNKDDYLGAPATVIYPFVCSKCLPQILTIVLLSLSTSAIRLIFILNATISEVKFIFIEKTFSSISCEIRKGTHVTVSLSVFLVNFLVRRRPFKAVLILEYRQKVNLFTNFIHDFKNVLFAHGQHLHFS